MNIITTEEIISKLSAKFNRIFYDREFICSVQEDFEVILKNTKECCVVIFPVLGPHYLKAVQYQAKILNLATFTLGTERITSVAVCHRDFLLKKLELDKEKMQVKEPDDLKTRQKRPERQLYVPPAQRSSRNQTKPNTLRKKDEEKSHSDKKLTKRRIETCAAKIVECENSDMHSEFIETTPSTKDDRKFYFSGYQYLDWFYYPHMCWEYSLFHNNVRNSINLSSFSKLICHIGLHWVNQDHIQIPIFSNSVEHVLFTLKDEIFLWRPSLNFAESTKSKKVFQTFSPLDFQKLNEYATDDGQQRLPLVLDNIYKGTMDHGIIDIFDLIWVKSNDINCSFLNTFCKSYFLFVDGYAETEIESTNVQFENLDCFDINNKQTSFVSNSNGDCEQESEKENSVIVYGASMEEYSGMDSTDQKVLIETNSDNSLLEATQNKDVSEMVSEALILVSSPDNSILECTQNSRPTATESALENSFILSENTDDKIVPKNKKTVKTASSIENKTLNKQINKKKDEHDEEKEIMRKTKENINRKSRPIMKYVDNTDELKIGEDDDNVNNWEDLFDESGQLHENIMKEIFQKVGNEVTIVKAKEDYSDYSVKQLEELEHMVELYDFPEALETNDLIHAFTDINSDAMYIKWVDNTHAILVLGSSLQAQKAMSKNHPLIKVRPMSAASNASLSTAYKHDLKPAMKRPQTNLQTARRMITTHLGRKSNVSQDKSAKEKNELREAKEMKKLIKKNEADAWEGNLRSSLN